MLLFNNQHRKMKARYFAFVHLCHTQIFTDDVDDFCNHKYTNLKES